MKKIIFSFLTAACLVACGPTPEPPVGPNPPVEDDNMRVIDFESNLPAEGFSCTESFSFGNAMFNTEYDAANDYWEGFALSSLVDTVTGDYTNQYSAMPGKAFSGKNFAVVYQGYNGFPAITFDKDVNPQEIYISNSTYGYRTIANGSAYSKKFEEGDYFYIKMVGMRASFSETDSVIVYLADFRDGKSEILKDWQRVDLTPLKKCRYINISFHSSDMGEWGINTPTYAVLDDLKYEIAK